MSDLFKNEMQNLFDEFKRMRAEVQEKKPLIHSITNPISINDCANAVLALGAKPIMAEHPKEAAGITALAQALTVSLANITDARAESMMLSGKSAVQTGCIPAVIDVVGVTCSPFRMALAQEFIQKCRPAVIKGNVSEMKAIAGVQFEVAGIDVGQQDAVTRQNTAGRRQMAAIIKNYAARVNAVVMASGEVDIISDGRTVYFVENGTENLAKVTGTGCMLNCITGVYLSAGRPLYAAVLAAVTLGIAGELADAGSGLGSYHIGLLDALSCMTDTQIQERMCIQCE